MSADDIALVADTEGIFFRLVFEFGRVCDWRNMRANISISKKIVTEGVAVVVEPLFYEMKSSLRNTIVLRT